MAENGFVKLDRSIVDLDWMHDNDILSLFSRLLLTANYKDSQWLGITIKRGQRVFSHKKLAQENNLSEQRLRTALKRLESTGVITIKSSKEYSIITLNNYDNFQQPTNQSTTEKPITSQLTTDTQSEINHQSTPNQPHLKKEERRIKKEE